MCVLTAPPKRGAPNKCGSSIVCQDGFACVLFGRFLARHLPYFNMYKHRLHSYFMARKITHNLFLLQFLTSTLYRLLWALSVLAISLELGSVRSSRGLKSFLKRRLDW